MEYNLSRTAKYATNLLLLEWNVGFDVAMLVIDVMINCYTIEEYIKYWADRNDVLFQNILIDAVPTECYYVFKNKEDLEAWHNTDRIDVSRLYYVTYPYSRVKFDLNYYARGSFEGGLYRLQNGFRRESGSTRSLTHFEFWTQMSNMLTTFINSP